MTKRVAIYTRVSRDNFGDERSPIRQEADCRAFAAIRDWEVIAAYRDVDLSAYVRRVRRPGYEALLKAVAEKQIEGVLVWKLDRLVRRSADFERFWASCESADVLLASVTEPIDTSNELGLAIVRILVTFAGLESSTKSLRLKSAARAAALAGKRHPGARNYGYTSTGSAIVPEEAAAIREAATRVLAGETLKSIARDFNTREIRRAQGGMWVGNSLRGILEHPSLAGLRSYQGEIVAKGSWPAILDEATSARLRLLFADPARRNSYDQRTSHLLRGFMRCGQCGGRLKPCLDAHRRRKGYTCYPKPDGCGRIYIHCDGVDPLVTSAALDRIAEVRRRAMHGHRDGEAPNAAVAERLERHRVELLRAARDYYVEHAIGAPQFLAVRDELDRVLGQERQELLSRQAREMLTRLGTQAPQVAWESFDLAQRREMLAAVLDHVVVHPAHRDSRFHPERVEIFWLGQGSLPPSATRAVPPPRRRAKPDERLTSKQAADYLGVKAETVTRLIWQGDLVGQKGERGWYITQAVVDAFLEERRLRPQRPRGRRPATATPAGH